jgi:hypothetical protein
VYADVGRTKVAPGEALDHVSTFSPLLGDEHDVYAIHRFDPPAPACPMELLMRAGSSYEMYDIEGGP